MGCRLQSRSASPAENGVDYNYTMSTSDDTTLLVTLAFLLCFSFFCETRVSNGYSIPTVVIQDSLENQVNQKTHALLITFKL